MTAHRRGMLSILGLVASDASYYIEGSRRTGDPLRSLPDSEPRDEHGFPDPLWMSILWYGDPLIGASNLTTAQTNHGALVDVIELSQWQVVRIVEGRELGFGATIYRLGDTSEYVVAMRGTDGPDSRDWLQNLSFSVPAWDAYRSDLAGALLTPLYGRIPAAGTVHFIGQSLGGGLAQYAAYEFVRLAKAEAIRQEGPRFVYSPDRVTLTTFNAFAGGAGLREIYDGEDGRTLFDPTMLAGVQTAHYAIANDLVHRLGAVMEYYSEEVDGVLQPRSRLRAGHGHLNGDGNTYLLDFRRPGTSDDDPQGYLNTIDAHRIEKGFYQGFDVYGGDFQTSSRLARYEIDYLDVSNAQWVASRFSRLFMSSKPELSYFGAGVRLVVGLASGIALGNPFQTATLVSAGIEAAYKQGSVSRAGQIALESLNLATVFLSMTVPALRIGRLVFTALDVFRDLSTREKLQALDLVNQTINPTQPLVIDVPTETSPFSDAERAIRYERAARVLAAAAALQPDQRVAYVADAHERERVQLLSRLAIDPDEFQATLDRPDWLYASNKYLMDRGYAAGLTARERVDLAAQLTLSMANERARYAAFDPALAPALELAQREFVLNQLGRAIANASKDFTAKYADAGNAFGTSILDFVDYQPIHDAFGAALADPRYAAIREDLARALGIADHAGQKVWVTRDPLATDPDPDAVEQAAEAEGGAARCLLRLAYAPSKGGQRVRLELVGAAASAFVAIVDGTPIPLAGGSFYVTIPEGAREAVFVLRNHEDVDQDATLTLTAQLVAHDGTATHLPHTELEIAFDARIEPETWSRTILGDVGLVQPYEQDDLLNPLVDAAQARPGSHDKRYDGAGDDLLLVGTGRDHVNAHAGGDDRIVFGSDSRANPTIDESPGVVDYDGDLIFAEDDFPWLDDYALGGPGRDTIVGGTGRDILRGGPGDDCLYSRDERSEEEALALGESEPTLSTVDWLSGEDGDDLLIGHAGIDHLWGGPGDDRIYGGAGDDNIGGHLTPQMWNARYTDDFGEWVYQNSSGSFGAVRDVFTEVDGTTTYRWTFYLASVSHQPEPGGDDIV